MHSIFFHLQQITELEVSNIINSLKISKAKDWYTFFEKVWRGP